MPSPWKGKHPDPQHDDLGQGAIRRHPYVLEEMAAAQNNDVDAFDKLLFKHIGHVGSNKVRSFWLGLTRGLTSATPTSDATKRYYQHLNRLSANPPCCLTSRWPFLAEA